MSSQNILQEKQKLRIGFMILLRVINQFVFVAEVPGPDDKIMVRLIEGILYIRGTGGFSKEVQIEGSNQMKISDFKYRNGVLTLRIS